MHPEEADGPRPEPPDQGHGSDQPAVEWVGEPGGYSVDDAYRILAGLPPGPVQVKSAAEISAAFRAAAQVPPDAPDRDRPPRARSIDEAELYLDLRSCPRCGAPDVEWEPMLVEVGGELATCYTGECAECGQEQTVVLQLPEPRSAPPTGDSVSFGGAQPSELLDPGEWLWVADQAAGNVPTGDRAAAARALAIAAAAVDEVLKFVPPFADEVPAHAFWSERGRQVRAKEPGRFDRERLAIVRDSYVDQMRQLGPVPTRPGTSAADWATARGPLTAEANKLLAAVYQARRTGDWERIEDYASRIDGLRDRYTALLPPRPVARCPYTGEVVAWPFDDVDLDGWFWRYDAPARRLPTVPGTWLAMTGAMRLGSPLTAAPFTCRPGPGAPFVVPSLLIGTDTTAVVAEVPVGPHTGWAVTYFGTRVPGSPLANLWGTGRYPVPDGTGGWTGWAEAPDDPADRDFDLGPWLASGRLRWIAPGDAELTLREGTDGCPYLDLEGSRESPTIEDGQLR